MTSPKHGNVQASLPNTSQTSLCLCPGNCDASASVGTYYRKHNPLISFNSIRNNATRCAKIVNADEFDTDLNGKVPHALLLAVPQRPSKRLLSLP